MFVLIKFSWTFVTLDLFGSKRAFKTCFLLFSAEKRFNKFRILVFLDAYTYKLNSKIAFDRLQSDSEIKHILQIRLSNFSQFLSENLFLASIWQKRLFSRQKKSPDIPYTKYYLIKSCTAEIIWWKLYHSYYIIFWKKFVIFLALFYCWIALFIVKSHNMSCNCNYFFNSLFSCPKYLIDKLLILSLFFNITFNPQPTENIFVMENFCIATKATTDPNRYWPQYAQTRPSHTHEKHTKQ